MVEGACVETGSVEQFLNENLNLIKQAINLYSTVL